MDIDQLEAFLSIAKTNNFTKSARLLHIAQSTISAKIDALEKHLGTPLFIRTNRSVVLTAAGEYFLPYAERVVSLVSEGSLGLHSDQRFSAALVIGGHGSIWAYGLASWLQSFRRKHPEVALHLLTGYAETIVQHIVDGVVDIGVVYLPPANPKVEVIPLYQEELILVGRHKPAQPIRSTDLWQKDYVHIDWGSPFSEWFETVIGPNYIPSFKLDNASVMLRILLDGGGYGFMQKSIVERYLNNGSLVRIPHEFTPPPPQRPIFVVYLAAKKNELPVRLGLELFGLDCAAEQPSFQK